jgi:RNA polymerase sigma factor (sigma-70 family)
MPVKARTTMRESDWLVERFERRRSRLRAVAYRMLGSLSEADDALQEVWLRFSRSDTRGVEHLDAWLTTVVGRVCLDMLRSRERRREEPFGVRLPDPVVTDVAATDPEDEVLLADSVGLALLVVIETLTPSERLAFVLHDMFGVSFDEIATVLDSSAPAARQLASRARRRIRGHARVPDADPAAQEEVVDAFFAAARDGDLGRLVALLHPDVVARGDGGPRAARVLRGAESVARAALAGARTGRPIRAALVNGSPGAVVFEHARPVLVMAFTVVDGKIAEIDGLSDRDRLRRLDLAGVGAPHAGSGHGR